MSCSCVSQSPHIKRFVCLLVHFFVTYRQPNHWTTWAEIWHVAGDGPWDGLWLGVTMPHLFCGRGRKMQKHNKEPVFRQKEAEFGVKSQQKR